MCNLFLLVLDFGATVVRVDRVGGALNYDVTARGKKSIAVDLKNPDGTQLIRQLATKFDVVLEPFRAGNFSSCGRSIMQIRGFQGRVIFTLFGLNTDLWNFWGF